GATLNACCSETAQTFTAGIDGTLAGVNVDVFAYAGHGQLNVAIRSVQDGVPTSCVLGSTTLDGPGAAIDDLIPFSDAIPMTAGRQYAIVLSSPGEPLDPNGLATWSGATGDQYPGGEMLTNADGAWIYGGAGYDVRFRTYVAPGTPPADPCPTIE